MILPQNDGMATVLERVRIFGQDNPLRRQAWIDYRPIQPPSTVRIVPWM